MKCNDWIEQAGGIMSDPLYCILAAEGEEIDPDDAHPALAGQQQILLNCELRGWNDESFVY
jgi:hypothetical protein